MATNKLSSSTSETGRNYIVTENNPWFGSTYTSYDTNEGGGYHFRKYPDGTFKMFDGRTGDYETVSDPEQIDYLKNRSSVLEQNSKNERVNLLGWMMPNRLLNTKFGNYIGHLENGGTMNYAQYLQDGGNVSQEDSQLQEIVPAFKKNPKAIISQILESQGITDPNKAKQKIPEIIQQFAEIAEQTQDSELGEIVSELFGEIGLLKCGGRVRAKIKKARCGKKLENGDKINKAKCGKKLENRTKVKKARCGKKFENGDKIPMAKKGTCPCQLKRVGGRLIEVDCNGIPVAKNGTVLYAKEGDAVKNYMTTKPITNAAPFSDQWFGDLGKAFVDRMNRWQNNLQQNNPSFWGNPTTVKKVTTVETTQPSVGSEAWKAQQRINQETYYNTPEGQKAVAKADEEIAKKQVAAEAERRTQEAAARRNAFGAGKQGTFGGLTYDEALKRQREMQMAKAQGFNVDLGRWGADGKWGRQSSGEWDRYQKWKADQAAAQELATMKAENANLTKLVEPQKKYFFAGSKDLLNIPASKVEVTVPSVNKFIAANVGDSNIRLASKYLQSGGKMTYADYLK